MIMHDVKPILAPISPVKRVGMIVISQTLNFNVNRVNSEHGAAWETQLLY
jgi:hypothetical protein